MENNATDAFKIRYTFMAFGTMITSSSVLVNALALILTLRLRSQLERQYQFCVVLSCSADLVASFVELLSLRVRCTV